MKRKHVRSGLDRKEGLFQIINFLNTQVKFSKQSKSQYSLPIFTVKSVSVPVVHTKPFQNVRTVGGIGFPTKLTETAPLIVLAF